MVASCHGFFCDKKHESIICKLPRGQSTQLFARNSIHFDDVGDFRTRSHSSMVGGSRYVVRTCFCHFAFMPTGGQIVAILEFQAETIITNLTIFSHNMYIRRPTLTAA